MCVERKFSNSEWVTGWQYTSLSSIDNRRWESPFFSGGWVFVWRANAFWGMWRSSSALIYPPLLDARKKRQLQGCRSKFSGAQAPWGRNSRPVRIRREALDGSSCPPSCVKPCDVGRPSPYLSLECCLYANGERRGKKVGVGQLGMHLPVTSSGRIPEVGNIRWTSWAVGGFAILRASWPTCSLPGCGSEHDWNKL